MSAFCTLFLIFYIDLMCIVQPVIFLPCLHKVFIRKVHRDEAMIAQQDICVKVKTFMVATSNGNCTTAYHTAKYGVCFMCLHGMLEAVENSRKIRSGKKGRQLCGRIRH